MVSFVLKPLLFVGMTMDVFVGASSLAGGDQEMYRESLLSKVIWFSEGDRMKSADWTTARQVERKGCPVSFPVKSTVSFEPSERDASRRLSSLNVSNLEQIAVCLVG